MLSLSLLASLAAAAPLVPIAPELKRSPGIRLPIAHPAGRAYQKRADGSFDSQLFSSLTKKTKQKYENNNKKAAANRARGLPQRRDSGTDPLTDLIDQGIDEEYYGPIQMGTPSQTLQIDFDTGSADLWVPTLCLDCLNGTTFDALASSTYSQTLEPFIIEYGSGEVIGTVATDTVTVAGLTVPTQYFGAVNLESEQFIGLPNSGLMGMAFSSIAQTGEPTFVENLIAAGQLDENLIAFYLTRGEAEGSELSIGTTDSSHYTGDIQYTPVTSETYWQVTQSGAVVDGNAVPNTTFDGAIDTGTTLIYVPTAAAAAIFAAVPGASYDATDSATEGADLYQIACDQISSVDIGFTFPGINGTQAIDPADLNLGTATGNDTACVFGIIGEDFTGVNGDDIAIIGDEFLKSHYSVYSYNGTADGAPAVGFADSA